MADRQALIESKIDKTTTNAISVTSLGIPFENMAQVMEFAKLMAVSGSAVREVFRENPGACLAITLRAIAFGFEPFSFQSKCYLVNGDVAYEAQLVHAIVLARAPLKRRPKIDYGGEGDKRFCEVTFEFTTGETEIYRSPPISQIKPRKNAEGKVKGSPLWEIDPDQQLAYWSVRAGARRHMPDVILGMYTPEELEYLDEHRTVDVTPRKADIDGALANGTKATETVVETNRKPAGKAGANPNPQGDVTVTAAGKQQLGNLNNLGQPGASYGEDLSGAATEPVQASGAPAGQEAPAEASAGAGGAPAADDGQEIEDAEVVSEDAGPAFEVTEDEKSGIEALRTALAESTTVVEIEVVTDEFAGLTANVRAEVGEYMQAMIENRRKELAPPPVVPAKRGRGRPPGSGKKAEGAA